LAKFLVLSYLFNDELKRKSFLRFLKKKTFLCSGLQSELEKWRTQQLLVYLCAVLGFQLNAPRGVFSLKQVQGTIEEWVCTKIFQDKTTSLLKDL
jgi:hypothetical protein